MVKIEGLCKYWDQVGQYFCPNSVTNWFIGTWVGPKIHNQIDFKFIGFCDRHHTEKPDHGNWDWKPVPAEEVEVYKIMEL